MTTCRSCGREVGPQDAFCASCGTSTAPPATGPLCPSCGKGVRSDAWFCPSCGASIGSEAAAASPRAPRAKRPAGRGPNPSLPLTVAGVLVGLGSWLPWYRGPGLRFTSWSLSVPSLVTGRGGGLVAGPVLVAVMVIALLRAARRAGRGLTIAAGILAIVLPVLAFTRVGALRPGVGLALSIAGGVALAGLAIAQRPAPPASVVREPAPAHVAAQTVSEIGDPPLAEPRVSDETPPGGFLREP